MKTKKLISIALCVVMALSLAIPSFALGGGTTDSGSTNTGSGGGSGSTGSTSTAKNTYSIDIPGGYEEIPLSVVIIGTGKAVINPYGIPYEIALETDEVTEDGNAVIEGKGITTTPLAVVNMSAAKLNIGATLTASGTVTIGESGDYSATDDADGDQAKGVYGITLEVVDNTKAGTNAGFTAIDELDPKEDAATLRDAITVACANWPTGGGYTLVMDEDAIDAGFATLKATPGNSTASVPGTNNLGQLDKYDADNGVDKANVAVFRVTANATMNPSEGEAWTTADTINIGVAFNFAIGA